ncbi:MAG: TIGR03560 family F420-dependent LLM class oxidoreductase [Acidimicrobiales bacterium]
MRIDLGLDQHQLAWPDLQKRATFAEDAGFDGIWVFDHFKALYGPPEGPCFEAWTLLAGLAAVTTRVRLGPLVTGVTYRHPSVLAAEVVTVDHLSGGRVELAMGAAWFRQEHEELGIDFPPPGERIARLDEALHVMTTLMSEKDASFDGRYYRLQNATYRPLPVQRPHPPIWVGGGGERRLLPVAARQADVWHGFGTVAELARKSKLLDRLAAEAGREPSAIRRSTTLSLSEPWDEVLRTAEGHLGNGFTTLIADWPSEGWPRVEDFVERMLPELQGLR